MTPLSKENKPQSVVFEAYWDVDGFISEELNGQRNLAPVLTLSGTVNKAFAATCEDYVRHFWPEFGVNVLERLRLVTQGRAGAYDNPLALLLYRNYHTD